MRRASPMRSYPADEPPWDAGSGDAELEALLASVVRRRVRLQSLLALPSDPLQAVQALDRWSEIDWRGIARGAAADPTVFRMAPWPRAQASVYTLVVDLGVALGEAAIALQAGAAWGVDRDAGHEADGRASVARAVVLAADARGTVVFDAIDTAFMRLQCHAFGMPVRAFIDDLRPLLWASHRHLFDAAPAP